jgi:hypothetical protein
MGHCGFSVSTSDLSLVIGTPYPACRFRREGMTCLQPQTSSRQGPLEALEREQLARVWGDQMTSERQIADVGDPA